MGLCFVRGPELFWKREHSDLIFRKSWYRVIWSYIFNISPHLTASHPLLQDERMQTQHLTRLMTTDARCAGVLRRSGVGAAPLVDPVPPIASLWSGLRCLVAKTPTASYRKTINLVVCLNSLCSGLRGDVEMSLVSAERSASCTWSGGSERGTPLCASFFHMPDFPSITKQQRNTGAEHLFQVRRYLEKDELDAGEFECELTSLCGLRGSFPAAWRTEVIWQIQVN